MTEIDEHEAKKQERIDRPRRLELKKTVETGQVRQSFAHGRSKMVTVEVRKKRTFAPDARGRMAEVRRGLELDAAKALDGSAQSAQPDGLPREGAAIGLTSQEKAARARALHDAIRIEEERHAAPGMEQMPALVDTPPLEAETPTTAEATVEQPIAVAREVEPTIEPPAESVAEPEPAEALATAVTADTATAETELRQASPEEPPSREETIEGKAKTAPDLALVKPKLPEADDEEVEKRGRSKRPVRADARKAASGVRRTEPGRRTGRLSLVDALDDGAERVRSLASVRRAREKERLKQQQQLRAEATKVIRDVVIPETITVQELANRMAERSADVIKSLMRMGVMATINHAIDADTAELLVTEFGHNVKRVSDADVEIGLKGESDDESDLQPRPAVVTVMGHVDHGKTSLLDALRKTNVVAQEAGGITQHIGAYQIALPGGEKITFIDTPGHEAFTQMRARGARVTDIVVLVVAADDGIMPQTVEAINHAKAANVPIVVAINKIDRPDANPARIRTDLLQHGVVLEEMGGETLCVEVSAKQGTNLDKLLETIVLQAELLDLRTNPNRTAEGVVVETKIERGRGSVATVLVQRGTLRTGDIFVAGSEWGRVRGLTDANGMALDSAGPSTPVEVLGLNGTPAAGDDVVVVESEARAREVTEFRQRRMRDARVTTSRGTFEQMLNRIQEGGEKQLPVVVKADVHGSMEAIVGALEKLSTDQAKAQILHAGIGGINESDVTLAGASNALIIGFNVRANPQARELAKRDGVEIRYYSIIYDLTDDLRKVLSGMLAPKLRETILGYAEIREVFSISKVGKVAGCMVIEGVIRRGARVRLLRDNVVVHEGELGQLKRFKDDVKEVREGYDCGVALSTYQDIQVGDTIECFEFREVMREP